MTTSSFSNIALCSELISNLGSLGYDSMTPIQAQSLPLIVAGKDVIAQGQTGSGKTAAFALGLLNKLNVKKFAVQTVVLCPTRELADQVAQEIRKLARAIHNIKVLTLCGGMPFGPQVGSLEHGAHIIVGTPGRIEDHLLRGNLKLHNVTTVVLDEADRMLDMGFQAALDEIISYTPETRQTLLFSATYPPKIAEIAKRIMHQPEQITVASTHDANTIKQRFYHVNDNIERYQLTEKLLLCHQPQSCVIFCNTKQQCQEVADSLCDTGFSALALHGDLEQRERDQTLLRFANKSITVLVATDVAARGLDIESLDAVINFHIAHDSEVHVHRIGRTGRAGSKGLALSLFSDKEAYKVSLLEDYLDQKIIPSDAPDDSVLNKQPNQPSMMTIQINGGKKQKMRPGDIVGALTGDKEIAFEDLGKIKVHNMFAYVAVNKRVAKRALSKLQQGQIKGRTFKSRLLK